MVFAALRGRNVLLLICVLSNKITNCLNIDSYLNSNAQMMIILYFWLNGDFPFMRICFDKNKILVRKN